MTARVIPVLGAAALIAALLGCGSRVGGTADQARTASTTGDTAITGPLAATPVHVAVLRREVLRVEITAPGQTGVLREDHIRAPFAGVLTTLRITDGDRVTAGEVVATIVSLNSDAAMSGASALLASARSAADSADARRALDLTRTDIIQRTITAPEAGIVLAHSASPGDRLAEGDDIARIAAANSSIFIAAVAQSDAAGIHAGQPVSIRLAAAAQPIRGTVHGVLPTASSSDFTIPVRVDFRTAMPVPSVGLFGTATITIGRTEGVLTAPRAAVLTDDVTGTVRVAVVRGDRARWVTVRKGTENGERIAVTSAGLASGDTVIVSGQVGLPDSTKIVVRP